MDQPYITPNLDENRRCALLLAGTFEKLKVAIEEIGSTDESTRSSALVKYFTELRQVFVWDVTERYAIDVHGNVLARWAHSDRNWPGVKYEYVPTPRVDRKGLEELFKHLDDI